MFRCARCLCLGYCPRLVVQLIGDDKLSDPAFIRDLRAHAAGLDIPDCAWREFLADAYRDYRGQIIDANGEEVFLDMEVFEVSGIRYWFRSFCAEPLASVRPYVRREARERVRVMATILAARDPAAGRMWGVRAANDNEPMHGA